MNHRNPDVSFIVPVSDETVLRNNFSASPLFSNDNYSTKTYFQKGFGSAAGAFNDGMANASSEILVFCHQDIVFPFAWLDRVFSAVRTLSLIDFNWGVMGCLGCDYFGKIRGNLLCNANGQIGGEFEIPQFIQTLDEVVIIMRKSACLTFDIGMPHFHLYGSDIVLGAQKKGHKNYVINAPCFHNTDKITALPPEFVTCYKYILKKWKAQLPIYSTCAEISESKYWYFRYKIIRNSIRKILCPRRWHRLHRARITDREEILRMVNKIV